MQPVARLLSLVAPPLCGVCGARCEATAVLCQECERSLVTSPGWTVAVPGVDAAWCATRYVGPARGLVLALKFHGRLPLAGLAGALIAAGAPPGLLGGALVPVPAAPARRRSRGFDPAAAIARGLADAAGMAGDPCLARADGPRQVGRARLDRLRDPPRVRVRGGVPRAAVLVDDVLTTGATLGACARALREGGSERVGAVAFAWSTRPRALAPAPLRA